MNDKKCLALVIGFEFRTSLSTFKTSENHKVVHQLFRNEIEVISPHFVLCKKVVLRQEAG